MSDEIFIVDESSLKDKIYVVRGVQVMLDYDLAQIYGYTTKAFNQQVKNNEDKFPDDFRFQLNVEEIDDLSRSKNFTPMQTVGKKGGRVYRPYAFTEQGIYMIMTVLKGDIATRQSIKLIRLFKELKDFVTESISAKKEIYGHDYLLNEYHKQSERMDSITHRIEKIEDIMVSKNDISVFIKLFDDRIRSEEVLILDGQPFKADLAYQKIYSKAKKSVMVIDDYIGVKTLQHLVHAPANVTLKVISDNKGSRPLRLSEYNDFLSEYPGRDVSLLQSCGKVHDRYIVLDEGTRSMKVFHCGASSKDAGKRITTITRIGDVKEYKGLVKEMNGNPGLVLS